MDEAGNPVANGQGTPDFRVVGPGKVQKAVKHELCWICGAPLAHSPIVFCIGPMCACNAVSSDGPGHSDCMHYAVQACPFLTKPRMRRNEKSLPEQTCEAPGLPLKRNPGVALLWFTDQTHYSADVGLYDLGRPLWVEWWCEGRPATRAEVLASIESGLPLLRQACDEEAEHMRVEAHAELDARVREAMRLVPAC